MYESTTIQRGVLIGLLLYCPSPILVTVKSTNHVCCFAHETKKAVQTILSIIIEARILSKPAPHNNFGTCSSRRSFTGAVLSTEAE